MQTALSLLFRAIKLRWTFCGALALCCGFGVQAQDIIYANGNPNPPFIFPVITVGGPALNVTISPVKAAAKPPITMTITSLSIDNGLGETSICSPCEGAQVAGGITFQSTGGTVTLTGAPLPAAGGNIIRFTIVASVNHEICQRSYTLNIKHEPRKPVDLGLVVDVSASMALRYDGSSTTDSTLRRWAGLMRGLHVMSSQISALSIPGDRIMVRVSKFLGNPLPPAPFNRGLIPMEGNVAQLQTTFNAIRPNAISCLAIGMLAVARTMERDTLGNNKAMILFSTGVSHICDTIQRIGPDAFVRTGRGEKLRGESNKIKIYTICLGTAGPALDPVLMQNIGNLNGGASLNPDLVTSFETEAEFAAMFRLHLENIMRGNAPQFVDVHNGKFPVSTTSELASRPMITDSFSVRKEANIVKITLFAPDQKEADMTSVKVGSTELIQRATQTRGDGFVTLAFQAPFDSGDWKVQARLGTAQQVEVPYVLTISVDDGHK